MYESSDTKPFFVVGMHWWSEVILQVCYVVLNTVSCAPELASVPGLPQYIVHALIVRGREKFEIGG